MRKPFLCFTEKLVLVLRDGRKLVGVLRSWDQFGMTWRSAAALNTYLYTGHLAYHIQSLI